MEAIENQAEAIRKPARGPGRTTVVRAAARETAHSVRSAAQSSSVRTLARAPVSPPLNFLMVLLSSNIIEDLRIPGISRSQPVSSNSSCNGLSIQGRRRQKTTEDEEECAAWKGGPPRAPTAREAVVAAPNSGGCRPPNPPLAFFLFFSILTFFNSFLDLVLVWIFDLVFGNMFG